MNKKLLLFLPFLLVGCSSGNSYKKDNYQFPTIEEEPVVVSFLYNFSKQEVNLNSGLYATGNSIALKVDQVKSGSKLTKPDIDPIREKYDFDGWHVDSYIESPWNFDNDTVTSNTQLFAHWKQKQVEPFIEPEYVPPSNVDTSLSTLISMNGVMNMPVKSDAVNLCTPDFNKLVASKDNVTSLLNFMIKDKDVQVTSTYDVDNKIISYTASLSGQKVNGTITCNDISNSLVVSNSYYETKAKNYEANATSIDDHRIMLAGSSSMENWKTSTEDMLPLTTYNHGIGGTTADEWKDKLNQRLVYPHSPKIVVYYVGVNNIINTGDSAEKTLGYLLDMFDDVHEHLPNTKVYYVLINALPNYKDKQPAIDQVNLGVIDYSATHEFLIPLNPGQLLLKANGEPNSAFFLTDGLHMSLYGYVLWGGYIKDALIQGFKENE